MIVERVNSAAPPRASDDQVLAWAKRHDLDCWDSLSAARAAFEDAQTLHMTAGVGEPRVTAPAKDQP